MNSALRAKPFSSLALALLLTAIPCFPSSHREPDAVVIPGTVPTKVSKSAKDQRNAKIQGNGNTPFPSETELKWRVLANLKKSQAELERYVCRTTHENDVTDKDGKVKKRDVRLYDMFFVNGQEIHQLKAKNGVPLKPEQQEKEEKRVREKIEKASDIKYVAKKDAENEKQLDMLFRVLRFVNGRRLDLHGRTTLRYDLSGEPNVHPHGTEETFLHNMSGMIEVDEATGQLVELSAHLDHDVKLGAGLLANVHKGFWIHIRQHRYPDGVWLPELAEGNGDARAALIFHPYFRFKQTMNGCALTNVTTSETDNKVARTQ